MKWIDLAYNGPKTDYKRYKGIQKRSKVDQKRLSKIAKNINTGQKSQKVLIINCKSQSVQLSQIVKINKQLNCKQAMKTYKQRSKNINQFFKFQMTLQSKQVTLFSHLAVNLCTSLLFTRYFSGHCQFSSANVHIRAMERQFSSLARLENFVVYQHFFHLSAIMVDFCLTLK